MTDLVKRDTATDRPGALAKRDSGNLVARGLADLERLEKEPSAAVCDGRGYECYRSGKYSEAARWYRLAADQGFARAQFNLGVMYATGRGVPQDDAEAVRWYRLAADQGFDSAQSSLGLRYATGEGVPQDDAEAVRWYRLAADQGHARAQAILGFMYANGRGVPQNDVTAHMWFNLAASRSTGNVRSGAVEDRDVVETRLTASQRADAQRRAREWGEAHPR